MQFLSAIAIIVLLFVAYNYMNKAHEEDGDHPKPENRNSESKDPSSSECHGPDNSGTPGRGKVLDFMEYKKKKSGQE